jgi:hypothetical protein
MMEYAGGGDLRNLIRKRKSDGATFLEEDILCEQLDILDSFSFHDIDTLVLYPMKQPFYFSALQD